MIHPVLILATILMIAIAFTISNLEDREFNLFLGMYGMIVLPFLFLCIHIDIYGF